MKLILICLICAVILQGSGALDTLQAARAAGPAEIIITPDSFPRAVAAATPGSSLLLADGVYPNVNLRFSAKGAADRPITLRAHHPGRAILTGKSRLTISGEYLVVSGLDFDQAWGSEVVVLTHASHCRLTECAFIECGNPASTFSHIITLAGTSQYNRIDHCFMRGNLSMGMGVRVNEKDCANTYNSFDHNYFRDITRRFSNGQEAVQIGQGGFSAPQMMHALVEYCLFVNASGDHEIISNKSSCNTYRFNTFRDCKGSLTLRGGGSALVQGNVFLNCEGRRARPRHQFGHRRQRYRGLSIRVAFQSGNGGKLR